MPVSEVIRRKRKELGLTQEQVAQRLGVSAPAVNKWERGGSVPPFLVGVSKGGNAPIWHTTLRSKV